MKNPELVDKPAVQIAPVVAITEPAADKYQAHAALAAGKLDLKDLNPDECAFLGTCQEIYRDNIGCYTPFESFFLDLVHSTMQGNVPTLESIRAELAEGDTEFANNWNHMLHGVKRFMQNYPDLIADLQSAAKGKAAQLAVGAQAA